MKWVREDFLGDSVETAKKLIGAVLVHRSPDGITAGRIVECEAYGGIWRGHEDDGAHAFKGLTPRTRVIFEEGGHAYLYLIYGMYTCLNVVCGHEGEGTSVLLRALEPLDGIDLMKERRHTDKMKLLASGPGRLTQAMGLNKSFYGTDLTGDMTGRIPSSAANASTSITPGTGRTSPGDSHWKEAPSLQRNKETPEARTSGVF